MAPVTTDPAAVSKDITLQDDGSYLIDCAAYIRDGDTGLLVPPADADALARAIETLLGAASRG